MGNEVRARLQNPCAMCMIPLHIHSTYTEGTCVHVRARVRLLTEAQSHLRRLRGQMAEHNL